MRILVTGGAGYIGSVAVRTLLQKGHGVVVVDNLRKGRRELVPPEATFYTLDVTSPDLDDIFRDHQFEAVLHFAAYKAVGESMTDAVRYSDNITGLTNVLNLMVKHKVPRIVYSSSAAVYGEPRYVPLDEHHPTAPVSFYGATKLIGELLLHWYSQVHGIKHVALRYFNVVGDVIGYVDPDAQNLLPIVMETALGKRAEVLVYGDDYPTRDGTGVRDYIDVQDLVDAHVLALGMDKSAVINLGTAAGTTVKELLALAEEVTGRKVPSRVVARRPGDPASVVASSGRARLLLGWEPKVPLRSSVATTWQAYWKAARANEKGAIVVENIR